MKVEQQIASCESEFQRIDILKTSEFGKVLVLDGELMITQKDLSGVDTNTSQTNDTCSLSRYLEIGRASCRERV